MKQQVGAFGDQVLAVVLDRGDHGFHRLLAEFLGAMLRTLVQQLAGVGRLSSRRRAGIDGGGKIMDRKTRHLTNSRARRWRQGASLDLALLSQRVVRDRAASAARPAPCVPWLGVW